ncbi:hypothetical protein N9W34_03145 [Rickettsiales bacterium]|nr:hypothetical protein [Rickettsiales bacterium]
MKIRILPLIIVVSLFYVGIKFASLFIISSSDQNQVGVFNIDQAVAQEEAAEPAEEEGEAEEDDGPSLGGNDENAQWSPGVRKGPKSIDSSGLGEMQQNIIENLSKRRQELQDWSDSISMKENILNATEKKVNRKLSELKKLQKEVGELLSEYESNENKKVKRLVKIYENMKAKDAARIFSEMEMSILLEVVGNMKEVKAAGILAKMDPRRAKEITSRLAQQRRLSQN